MTTQEAFKCVLCKDSFDDKETLQIHFRKHGDPSFNMQNTKQAQSETDVSKDGESKSELVSCDICPEVFPTISKAITHKHKVHPEHDAKYFCHWCGKLFTMKHLFNKHLTSHDTMIPGDNMFHCDCCDVDFMVPSAMTYHNKFFHRQDTELPVLGHSKKQKLINKELMQLYYCAFCGEEYINKVNLHNHMRNEHGDENQSPNKVLRCPLCEAVFYHLDAYEVHLTFHSSEDIYNGKEDDVRKDDLTEFTLDTVPPVEEIVENIEPEGDDALNIDDFLHLGLGDNDDTNVLGRKKHKKHKKHKKSKKDAITLDEFLNMNSDVFGEGLDFQGVEEVPTKDVKRLNAKKKPQKVLKTFTKVPASAELEKLKHLGIAIKLKSVKKPQLAPEIKTKNAPVLSDKSIKIANNVISKANKQNTLTSVKTCNEDVLSKLRNQSQNQIVISKKPQVPKEPTISPTKSVLNDKKIAEKGEVQCDAQDNTLSELGAHEKTNPSCKVIPLELASPNIRDKDTNKSRHTVQTDEEKTDSDHEDVHVDRDDTLSPSRNADDSKLSDDKNAEKACSFESSNANILKSISQHITIKSVVQSKPGSPFITQTPKTETKIQTKNVSNLTENTEKSYKIDQTIKAVNGNENKKASDVLKTLGQLIVKSQKPAQTLNDETDFVTNQAISNQSSAKEENKVEHNTSIKALRKINPNLTINSSKKLPGYEDSNKDQDYNADVDHHNSDENESAEPSDSEGDAPVTQNKSPTKQNVSPTPIALKNIGQGITIKKSSTAKIGNTEEIINKGNLTNESNSFVFKNKQTEPMHAIQNLSSQLTVKSSKCLPKNIVSIKEMSKDEEIFSIDDSDSDDIEISANTMVKRLNHLNRPPHKVVQAGKCIPAKTTISNFNKNMTVTKKALEENVNFEVSTREGNEELADAEDEIMSNVITKPEITEVAQKLMKNKNIVLKNINANLPQTSIKNMSKPQKSPSNSDSERQVVLYNPAASKQNSNLLEKYELDNTTKPKITLAKASKPENTLNNEGLKKQILKFNPNANFTDSEDEEMFDALSNHSSESDSPLTQSSKVNRKKNEEANDINKNLKDFVVDSDEHQFSDDFDEETCGSNSQSLINKLRNINQNLSIKSSSQNNQVISSSCSYQKASQKIQIKSANDSKRQIMQNKINCLKRDSAEYSNDDDNNDCTTSSKQMKVVEEVGPEAVQPGRASAPGRQPGQPGRADTVDQQVTTSVKTIQSETVVEEITTTVTRTIKTINREVSMSNNQSINTGNISTPNIVRGPRPRFSSSLQGVAVRQATATATPARPRTRQTAPSRPVVNATVRAPNQITPVRPAFNQIRSAHPRLPIRPRSAANNQLRPNRPIKIAQNVKDVLTKVNKAPGAASDNPGHFSCFKKPKESLIPIDSSDDEATFAIPALHTSKMNLGNNFKSIQSESVVEMKSEVRSSSNQQISKLSTISGLTIVKSSSQSKQVVNKVEKCEVSGNRTLDAIERLQRQGLLVKKPRLDEVKDAT